MKAKSLIGWCTLAVFCVSVITGTANGHNLWVTAQGRSVRVVFEHSPNPGQGTYNAEILNSGKTWVRTADKAGENPIILSETGQPGTRFLTGSTEIVGPRVIEHSCLFGIYRGRLDFFYGKFLEINAAEQLKLLGEAPRLPLDIVPKLIGKRLELKVLWQGERLQDYRFGVVTPDHNELTLHANDEGTVTFEPTQKGTYGFWVIRLDDQVQGKYKGDQYTGTMHATTLSLNWPLF